VAYRTQMRTHEIGIRMALGASRVDVLRLVLLQGLWLTGIGLALGLAFALGLTRHYRPAVVRNRRQRSGHRRFRRHAPGSNVVGSMLPSGTSSDAPEPRDRDSRTVSRSSDSTRIRSTMNRYAHSRSFARQDQPRPLYRRAAPRWLSLRWPPFTRRWNCTTWSR
jgi:hypothetical protein